MYINQVLLKVRLLALAIENTSIFTSQLKDNINLVISQVQMHSWTHNVICFKYDCNTIQCRFYFPWPIIPNSHINNAGSIFLQRNNIWVNPWNPAFASILPSNLNVTFVALSNNALVLIHYIIDYEIKSNRSQYQQIIGAVLVKKAYDDMQSSANVITNMPPNKFAFRAFNRLVYN